MKWITFKNVKRMLKMKSVYATVLLLGLGHFSIQAQVGIGTGTPNSSAMLEVQATDKGLLPPRVALTASNAAGPISSPATGLLVYNTATAGTAPNNVTPGFYYWSGSAWLRLNVPTDVMPVASGGTGTSNGSITGTGALDFTSGSNQNIRLNSGTGTVGVGASSSLNASAQLDVNSSNKGFLPPRVALSSTTSASPITSPATGLLVYNTATSGSSPNNVVPGYYYNSGTTSSPAWKRLATVEVDNTFKLVSTGTALVVNQPQDITTVIFNDVNSSELVVVVPSGFATNRIILQWNVWGEIASSTTAQGSLRFQIVQTSPTSLTTPTIMMTGWALPGAGPTRWAAPASYVLSNVAPGTYTFKLQVRRDSEGGTITKSIVWGVSGTAQVFVQ